MAEAESPALARLRSMIKGEVPPPSIANTLGIRLVSADIGRVSMEMEVTDRLYNPMGTLHGGVLCDIADAAMGMAYVTTLQPGETFTTIELNINFLRPVWSGTIRADASMLKGGHTVGLVECRVHTPDGHAIAHVTSTCMTLRGEMAKGR
jgi:uncharacterized protein (TIGR00369 family)